MVREQLEEPRSVDDADLPPVDGSVHSREGLTIPIRAVRPEDAPALQRFHSRLSAQTVYYRFFECVPMLTDRQAGYFTRLDGISRYALLALDPEQPGEIIGVVRYDRQEATDRAEYAIVIEDRWQHHGLGLELTRRLLAVARARGIRYIEATVLMNNRGMLHLFQQLGLPMQIEEGPELLVRIDLHPTPAAPPAAS
jgi:RimJ/RimL family protein N-acetyltransferase